MKLNCYRTINILYTLLKNCWFRLAMKSKRHLQYFIVSRAIHACMKTSCRSCTEIHLRVLAIWQRWTPRFQKVLPHVCSIYLPHQLILISRRLQPDSLELISEITCFVYREIFFILIK